MSRKILHSFVLIFILAAMPSLQAQDPEIFFPFKLTQTAFAEASYAIGMDSTAKPGLDAIDRKEIQPPLGPISKNAASFRIGTVASARDFRPISSSASYLLDLVFRDTTAGIVLEWNPELLQAGGAVFEASKTNSIIGGSNTDGFSKFEVRDINGTVLVNLQNPVAGGNVTITSETKAQYKFAADSSGFKTVQIIMAVDNAKPIAVDDPENHLYLQSTTSPFTISVTENDIETDTGQTISIVDDSFPATVVDDSLETSVTLGSLSKSFGSETLEFTPAPELTNKTFTDNSKDKFEGTFQYRIKDNHPKAPLTSDPGTVTVTVFKSGLKVERTLDKTIAKAGEGEDIWVDVNTGTANQYDDGVDTKVFDGSPDDTDFSNGFQTDSVPGITTGILYNDISPSGYSKGEDIWQDVNADGKYDTGDIQIYDGGDGWDTADNGSVTGVSGLLYHDADGSGSYTHDETTGLGLTVTLNFTIDTSVVTDLTKFVLEETLPSDFKGFWYIPVTEYGSAAGSERLSISALPDASYLPEIKGNGVNRKITLSWKTNPADLKNKFSVTYRIVGPEDDLLLKTTEMTGPKEATGFVNSRAEFDPDDSVTDDEIIALIPNTGFQSRKTGYSAHSADFETDTIINGFAATVPGADSKINTKEFNEVLILSKMNNGFHIDASTTTTGFAEGTTNRPSDRTHSADYQTDALDVVGFPTTVPGADWKINTKELNEVLILSNSEKGYEVDASDTSGDGFKVKP